MAGGGQRPNQQQNWGYHHGLHQHNTVQSATQLQQQAQAEARAANSWAGPFGPVMAAAETPVFEQSAIDGQVKNLRQGLTMRGAPSAPRPNYLGQSHEQLYQSVQSIDAGTIGSAADTWTNIGNKLTAKLDTVAQALGASQSTWTGKAADAARQTVTTLGNASGQAGQATQLAGTVLGQQAQAAQTAKTAMPEPPKTPFSASAAQAQLQTISDPFQFAVQAAQDHAQQAAQNAAHQQAASVVQSYDSANHTTINTQPAFAPKPADAEKSVSNTTGSTTSTGAGSGVGGGQLSRYGAGGGARVGSTGGTGSSGGGSGSSGVGAGYTASGVGVGSGSTSVPSSTTTSDYSGGGSSGGTGAGGTGSGYPGSGSTGLDYGSGGSSGAGGGGGAGGMWGWAAPVAWLAATASAGVAVAGRLGTTPGPVMARGGAASVG